jgi:hypothetical protein
MLRKEPGSSQALVVAHACNPSYSRGNRLEGSRFKASRGKQFTRPYLEKNHHKKGAGGVAQGVGPEFKPQYHKKTKQNKNLSPCLKQGRASVHQ